MILLELVLVSLYALLVNTVRFTVKGLKLDGKLSVKRIERICDASLLDDASPPKEKWGECSGVYN